MENELLIEILSILDSNDSKEEKKEKLTQYHSSDLADFYEQLDDDNQIKLKDILGIEEFSELLTYVEQPEEIFENLENEEVADVIELMDADDAVDILQEMSEEDRNEVINLMDEEAKEDIQLIMSFDEEQIGSLMTTNYVTVQKDDSIKVAMKKVINQANDNDNISTILVTDEEGNFYGAIELPQLIVAREGTPLENIIRTNYPSFKGNDLIDDCINDLKDYYENIIPVVDEDNKIIGVITSSDIVELVTSEAAEDYNKLAGVLEEEELDESVFGSMKKRIPWLIMLLVLGLVVSLVVSRFEKIIAAVSAAVFFQSVVFDMAGNGGTQSLAVTLTTITKSDKLDGKKFWKMFYKELRVGLLNGICLSILSFACVFAFLCITKQTITSGRPFEYIQAFKVGGCVSLSLLIALSLSSLLGLLLPILFKKIRIDPAVASGPMITTINDICSACIYYLLVAFFFGVAL